MNLSNQNVLQKTIDFRYSQNNILDNDRFKNITNRLF